MLAKTHLAFGVLAGILLLPLVGSVDPILFFALVLIGSLFPDIDAPNSKISKKIPIIPWLIAAVSKHRGIFHSVWFAIAISFTLAYFTETMFGIALLIGYLSHLLADGLTTQGVNLIHPIGRIHLAGFIETGKTGELVLFLGLVGVIIYIVL